MYDGGGFSSERIKRIRNYELGISIVVIGKLCVMLKKKHHMKHIFLIILVTTLYQYSYAQTNLNDIIKVEISFEERYDSVVSTYQFRDEIEQYGYSVNSDSVKLKYSKINVDIINKSSQPIYLWFVGCQMYRSFETNNDNMIIETWGCGKFKSYKLKIEAKEKYTYNLLLYQSIRYDYPEPDRVYGYPEESTKIGLIVFDEIYHDMGEVNDYWSHVRDKSGQQRVWSNPINLLDYKSPKNKN